jgi:hypothetical protein
MSRLAMAASPKTFSSDEVRAFGTVAKWRPACGRYLSSGREKGERTVLAASAEKAESGGSSDRTSRRDAELTDFTRKPRNDVTLASGARLFAQAGAAALCRMGLAACRPPVQLPSIFRSRRAGSSHGPVWTIIEAFLL